MKSAIQQLKNALRKSVNKKIFLIVALLATAFAQPSFAQTNQTSSLLNDYYLLKDALIKSNAADAAVSATELGKAINALDKETLKDESRKVLLKDAAAISQTKNIKIQREKFAALSTNMANLAKTVKLSADPVYLQYCPMKKASWLSNNKAIKNPYFGNAMLTCGSTKESY